MAKKQTAGRDKLGDLAPKFAQLNDDVLFVILLLPAIFGSGIIWFTFGIYEALVLIVSVVLLKHSERNGIVYQ